MNKRMYIICRGDLNPLYASIQGGHALADFALRHPEDYKEWGNSFLIYLKTKDKNSLHSLEERLQCNGYKNGRFIEPDIGHELTAISCYATPDTFKSLKTLKI